MPKNVIIAIDGPSSSGKSTLAKHLATALHFDYIDSGAFYRAVTWYCYQHHIDWNNEGALMTALDEIEISFYYDSEKNESKTFLNGDNIEPDIRSMTVSTLVSEISTIPPVRSFIVDHLRRAGGNRNLVMDGRDIGTVVFPESEIKIYLIADEKVRSNRRFTEMKNKGQNVTENQITENLSGRDLIDSTRNTAPLKKAEDAIVLDNSHMTEKEQFAFVMKLVKERMPMYYPDSFS